MEPFSPTDADVGGAPPSDLATLSDVDDQPLLDAEVVQVEATPIEAAPVPGPPFDSSIEGSTQFSTEFLPNLLGPEVVELAWEGSAPIIELQPMDLQQPVGFTTDWTLPASPQADAPSPLDAEERARTVLARRQAEDLARQDDEERRLRRARLDPQEPSLPALQAPAPNSSVAANPWSDAFDSYVGPPEGAAAVPLAGRPVFAAPKDPVGFAAASPSAAAAQSPSLPRAPSAEESAQAAEAARQRAAAALRFADDARQASEGFARQRSQEDARQATQKDTLRRPREELPAPPSSRPPPPSRPSRDEALKREAEVRARVDAARKRVGEQVRARTAELVRQRAEESTRPRQADVARRRAEELAQARAVESRPPAPQSPQAESELRPPAPRPPPPSGPRARELAAKPGDQRSLLDRMNEALRQSSVVGPPAVSSGSGQSFEEALSNVDLDAAAHPAATPPASPLELDELSSTAEAGRLQRQTLLQNAVASIGAGLPLGARPSGPRPSPSAPSPNFSEAQLEAQLAAREALVGQQDHYAMLGLTQGASREQIKAAFISLAKVFHPDRLPPSLPHLAQRASAVFDAIREANETLSDDDRRAAWEATVRSAPPRVPSGADARATELLREGEAAFKKRSYRAAEAAFAQAHALDALGSSLAAQAWAIYMDPSRKQEAEQAKGLMRRALELDPTCERAHYQLGVIARVEGDMDGAERHFREAVRHNPRHLEANQELRLIDLRKKKLQPSQKKGFFR